MPRKARDFGERLVKTKLRSARLNLTGPIDGTVYGLTVTTNGGRLKKSTIVVLAGPGRRLAREFLASQQPISLTQRHETCRGSNRRWMKIQWQVNVSLAQLKVMSAIEHCRTGALGGHVERCEDCAHTRISYNSCLMGKSRNGELASRHQHFSVNCSALGLHNSTVLRLRRLGH